MATVEEMHRGLSLEVQKIDSNAFDTLLPEERDYYLNKAVDIFIKQNFDSRANRLKRGFEQSSKRLEDFRTLIKTSELECSEVSQPLLTGIGIDKADLPNDHYMLLSVGLKVFYNANGISFSVNAGKREPDGALGTEYAEMRIPAKFFQHDDIYTILQDPFNKPRITKGVFTVDDGSIYSYTSDQFITDKVVVTYLKKPAEIDLDGPTDCDLSETVHDDIIDLAAKLITRDLFKGQASQ